MELRRESDCFPCEWLGAGGMRSTASLGDDRIAACDFAPVTACPAAARSKQRSGTR